MKVTARDILREGERERKREAERDGDDFDDDVCFVDPPETRYI